MSLCLSSECCIHWFVPMSHAFYSFSCPRSPKQLHYQFPDNSSCQSVCISRFLSLSSHYLLLQAVKKKRKINSSPENAVDHCVRQHLIQNASAKEGEVRRICKRLIIKASREGFGNFIPHCKEKVLTHAGWSEISSRYEIEEIGIVNDPISD